MIYKKGPQGRILLAGFFYEHMDIIQTFAKNRISGDNYSFKKFHTKHNLLMIIKSYVVDAHFSRHYITPNILILAPFFGIVIKCD